MAAMTIDLRALDRDLDALATGLAFPVSGGARGPAPRLTEVDAALAVLAAGVAAGVAAGLEPDPAPRKASRPAPPRSRPLRAHASRASSPVPEAAPAASLVAEPADSRFDTARSEGSPLAVLEPEPVASGDASSSASAASVDAEAADAARADDTEAQAASEPPTQERAALPSSEVVFGEVDPTVFDEEESTSLVSFATLAALSGPVSEAAPREPVAPASSAPAALSAESLFGDEASTSLLLSGPLEFVGAAPPAAAAAPPSFDDATSDVPLSALAGDDDDARASASASRCPTISPRCSRASSTRASSAAPAVAEPMVDEATRVEDGEFEMFVDEDELYAVSEVEDDVAPGPAPLPASATSPSVAPPASDTAALEGQEKKGFFKKIFGK